MGKIKFLYTVVLKGPDTRNPDAPDRVFETWRVLAVNPDEAVEIVTTKFLRPYQRSLGNLICTEGLLTYPKPNRAGEKLVVTFVGEPYIAGGEPSEHEAYTEDGLTWRWTTNDSYLFDDTCAKLGVPVDFEAQKVAREAETERILARYREQQAAATPEQRAEEEAEARAAFGPGTKVVNVITGRSYTT